MFLVACGFLFEISLTHVGIGSLYQLCLRECVENEAVGITEGVQHRFHIIYRAVELVYPSLPKLIETIFEGLYTSSSLAF